MVKDIRTGKQEAIALENLSGYLFM
jgi:hypothetical protein